MKKWRWAGRVEKNWLALFGAFLCTAVYVNYYLKGDWIGFITFLVLAFLCCRQVKQKR